MKTLQEFKKSEKALNKEIKEYYEKQYSGEYVSLDGIVDINQYYNCAERILWVMKEPNGMKGIDMREYLKDNNECKNPETFNPILYITYGILNKVKYSEIPDAAKITDMFKKIAFINIKKVDGVNASTDEELKESYKNDGKYILKQIQLYKPAIIIAADTYDFFDDDYYDYCVDHMVSESDGFESRLIEKSKCLIRWNNEKILFDALHPNQRSVSQDIYCDTIIENYIRYRASHLQNTDY